MAADFNRERSLLRFAEECEDAASGLLRFRQSLPRSATRITAIVTELFAISAVLRQIHNEEGVRRFGSSFYRINEDLQLVFRTLQITLGNIFDMFGNRERPDQVVWDDLNYRMGEEEGFDLLERLEWYRDFLDMQSSILEGGDIESPRQLRQDLRELFEAQSAAQRSSRQRRRSFVSGATTPVPRIHITPAGMRPPLPRMNTPISPTVMSDEWDNFSFDRHPIMAPEPPLSPTFTSSSSHTMSSSQTSYSSDPRMPVISGTLVHWAQDVFDGSNPATRYKPRVQLDDRSSCHGTPEPDALQHLVRDGFQRALQLAFDQDRLQVRFYWRPDDHRARILIMTKDRGQHLHYCTPLTNLKIIRNGSCLQLCRARQDGRYSLWARLNFLFHERMVLFYSTFVAMKCQDQRGVAHRDLVEDFELLDPNDGEQELFAGKMKHDSMYHALRLFLDQGSGVVRLEASPLRGPRKNVPIWTAFVTKYAYDPDWAAYERGGVVSFAAIRPSPSVFIAQYEPPTHGGNYILPFTTNEDALMFMETWAGLCRSHGR